MCRLVEKLLPLQNARRLKEWVEQARAGRAGGALRGGDEGLIKMMRKLPFSLVHEVQLPGQTRMTDGAVPMIFCMTTQGVGSGLDTSRRLSKGGDLQDNMVYCDGSKVARAWFRWTVLVYDHFARKLLEVCAGFIQSESYEAVSQVLATWKSMGNRGWKGEKESEAVEAHIVNPKKLMLDAAEGAVRATIEAFKHFRVEGRGEVGSCAFHFHECRRRQERENLPEACREEHKMRCNLLLGSETQREMEAEAEELMLFYNEKCTTKENALKMEGWLQYWLQR